MDVKAAFVAASKKGGCTPQSPPQLVLTFVRSESSLRVEIDGLIVLIERLFGRLFKLIRPSTLVSRKSEIPCSASLLRILSSVST